MEKVSYSIDKQTDKLFDLSAVFEEENKTIGKVNIFDVDDNNNDDDDDITFQCLDVYGRFRRHC